MRKQIVPIIAEEARNLVKQYKESKVIKIPNWIYSSIERNAKRGQTSINISRISEEEANILRENGFNVAACNAPGRINSWSRTVISWDKPPYIEPPRRG